jgi:nucleotide-binding universal stress UspA family protein
VVLGWWRGGNASSAQNGKVIDGAHSEQATAGADALKPDLLPDDQHTNGMPVRPNNILVAVKGDDLDREIVSLGCKVALQKKNATIYIVYVIEVPRAKAIDDPMTEETDQARVALTNAAKVAKNAGVTSLQREIVQSRDQGHSLVDEVEAHHCSLLIVGMPYQESYGGQMDGVDAVAYVLQHAPSKVWIVRDRPHDPAQEAAPAAERSAEQPSEQPSQRATAPASERPTSERPAEHVATR